jgi:HSP20 family molecular chaperone IbpA
LGKKEERKKEDKYRDIFDILNLRILGIDFGELIKNWVGDIDIKTLIEKPEEIEKLRAKIEEQRAKLQETQRRLREKYGDAIRIDYDIRIGSLLGRPQDLRIGGGEFFTHLDQLAKERARRALPIKKFEVPSGEEIREPFIEVFDENEHLEVLAELPGVEEKNIQVNISENKITISATNKDRKYQGETTLPTNVEALPLQKTYTNGVLKIKLKKK